MSRICSWRERGKHAIEWSSGHSAGAEVIGNFKEREGRKTYDEVGRNTASVGGQMNVVGKLEKPPKPRSGSSIGLPIRVKYQET
jgi:hypothetical protein